MTGQILADQLHHLFDPLQPVFHPGAIVILHDGGGPRDQTVAALRTLIPRLRARGYRLLTVPQLLGLRPRYSYR